MLCLVMGSSLGTLDLPENERPVGRVSDAQPGAAKQPQSESTNTQRLEGCSDICLLHRISSSCVSIWHTAL